MMAARTHGINVLVKALFIRLVLLNCWPGGIVYESMTREIQVAGSFGWEDSPHYLESSLSMRKSFASAYLADLEKPGTSRWHS